MPAKARPGKQKSHGSTKKRLRRSGKGKWLHNKAAHNHLLGQKSRRQKRKAKKMKLASSVYNKQLTRMISK